MSSIQQHAENIVQKGFEDAELAKLTAENAASTVGETANATTQAAVADIRSTVETIKNAANDAAHATENKAETIASSTDNFEKEMAAKTNVAVEQGKADVHNAREKVQGTSEGLIGQAKGIVSSGIAYGQDYVHQVQSGGFIPATRHAATDAYTAASSMLSSAAATAQPHVESAKKSISNTDTASTARGYGAAVHEKAGPVVGDAKNTGASYATQAQTAITDAANKVAATTGPYFSSTQEKTAPYIEKAQDAASPYVQKAQEAAAPYIKKAQEAAAPHVEGVRGAVNVQGNEADFGGPKTGV